MDIDVVLEKSRVTQRIILFEDLFLNESPYVTFESDMYLPPGLYIDKNINLDVVGENENQYFGKPYINSNTIVFFDKKRHGIDYCIARIGRHGMFLNWAEVNRLAVQYLERSGSGARNQI